MRTCLFILLSAACLSLASGWHRGPIRPQPDRFGQPTVPYQALVMEQACTDDSLWLRVFMDPYFDWYAAGLARASYSIDIDHPHHFTSFQSVGDTAMLQAFIRSGQMKQLMQRAGVVDDLHVSVINVLYDNNVIMQQERLFITMRVSDFHRWQKAFDRGHRVRSQYGLVDRLIGCDIHDPDLVTVYLGVTDMARAHDFISSSQYRHYLSAAGVIGSPKLSWYKWQNYRGWYQAKD